MSVVNRDVVHTFRVQADIHALSTRSPSTLTSRNELTIDARIFAAILMSLKFPISTTPRDVGLQPIEDFAWVCEVLCKDYRNPLWR